MLLLILINFKLGSQKKINIIKKFSTYLTNKSRLSRLLKKIIITLKIWAILSIIFANKKVIITVNILKSYKTSIDLSNFYINNPKNKNWLKNYIRLDTLYLVFYDF